MPSAGTRYVDEFNSFKRLRDPRVATAIACQADHETCFAASQLVEGPSLAQCWWGGKSGPRPMR